MAIGGTLLMLYQLKCQYMNYIFPFWTHFPVQWVVFVSHDIGDNKCTISGTEYFKI